MLKQLLSIYPQIEKSSEPNDMPDTLCVRYGEFYYSLGTQNLSETERLLIETIIAQTDEASPWIQFLTQKKPITFEMNEGVIIIQFHLLTIPESANLWLETFQSLFETVIEAFYTSTSSGALIIAQEIIDVEVVMGQIMAMNSDFGINASVYIGQTYFDESSLNVCGNEEIEIFKTLENYPRVHTFKSSWLRHWIGPAIHSSEIARNLKRNISNEDEDGLLIQALWESRGNLSTASNQLFIHRNTLNYRIDRFKEKTGLNLRDYDDLLMVYLMNI